jgi:hypothetical protein
MTGVHHVILALARTGYTPEQIADKTGVPLNAVIYILKSPLARAETSRVS